MSVFGLERSQTSTINQYDHAISLVDSTKPKESPERNADVASRENSPTRTDSGNLVSRQITKGQGTLRRELARRKYAKYQKERDDDNDDDVEASTESGSEAGNSDPRRSQENERTGRLRDKIPFRSKKKARKSNRVNDSFIDVLYENQRGSFLCGIPLYSSNSLLNFDPSPWQTANFQDSAVNITNFQLPDPSWVWDWKTWYVDMSRDVDEEGWEYSFSFNKAYAWHGNHPWLFSFVRRRRWLRRRVKIHSHRSGERKSRKDQPHMLNEDYFTIHAPKRDRSRDSSGDRTTLNRSSYLTGQHQDSDDELDLAEITNTTALTKALKKSRVDREKITAVKAFIDQGGDELFYLADSIPQMMEMFVHQTSRRQLQTYLLEVLDAATRTQTPDEGKGKEKATEEVSNPDNIEAQKRKIDNLLKAVHAAGVHVNDLAFWSDLRARATSSETDPTNQTHALDATEPAEVPKERRRHSHSEDEELPVKEEIKGIPDDAQVSMEPRLRFAMPGDGAGDENVPPSALDKGKGKA
ncbi:hypothetical protein ACLMJK_000455 [Lecanora helva]